MYSRGHDGDAVPRASDFAGLPRVCGSIEFKSPLGWASVHLPVYVARDGVVLARGDRRHLHATITWLAKLTLRASLVRYSRCSPGSLLFPKMSGRMHSEFLSHLHFGSFHRVDVLLFPQHFLGSRDARRDQDYTGL